MGPSSQSSFYTHLCPPAAFLRPRRDRPSPRSAEPEFTDTGKIGKTASGRNCLSPMQLSAPPCRAETTSRHVRSDRVCVELLFGLIWHECFFWHKPIRWLQARARLVQQPRIFLLDPKVFASRSLRHLGAPVYTHPSRRCNAPESSGEAAL